MLGYFEIVITVKVIGSHFLLRLKAEPAGEAVLHTGCLPPPHHIKGVSVAHGQHTGSLFQGTMVQILVVEKKFLFHF